MSPEAKILPEDLLKITPREELAEIPILWMWEHPFYVAIDFDKLGQKSIEAQQAFGRYRMYSEDESLLDRESALEQEQIFIAITGFSPSALLEIIFQKEEKHGFSTRKKNLLLE